MQRGKLVAIAIPFKTFKEKIRIMNEHKEHKRIVEGNIILVFIGGK